MKIRWEWHTGEEGAGSLSVEADDQDAPTRSEIVKAMAFVLGAVSQINVIPGVRLQEVDGEPGWRYAAVALDIPPEQFEAEVLPKLIDAGRKHAEWLIELGAIDG